MKRITLTLNDDDLLRLKAYTKWHKAFYHWELTHRQLAERFIIDMLDNPPWSGEEEWEDYQQKSIYYKELKRLRNL